MLFLCAVISAACAQTTTIAPASDRVVLQLRWDHQFQFAGYYAALWNGYYAAEGLEVDIRSAVSSEGIASAIEEVSEGRAQFGIGSSDILMANDKGVPLTVVSSIFQTSASTFFALEETQMGRVTDLLNLKVARRVGDLIDVELQAMLRAEGLPADAVVAHPHHPGIDHLLDGTVDVVPGYSISLPYSAQRLGVRLRELKPSAYGIDFYGDSLFARRDLVESDPELVERFVRASLKGWRDALSAPETYIARIASDLTRFTALPEDEANAFNRFQARGVDQLALFGVVELGHMNPDRWRRMHTVLSNLGLIDRPLDIDSFIFDPIAQAKRWDDTLALISIIVVGSSVIIGILTILWNASLRRQVSERTREIDKTRARRERDKQRLDEIIEGTNIGTWELDATTGIAVINEHWAGMLGYTLEEMGETSLDVLLSHTRAEDRAASHAFFKAHLSGDSEFYAYESRALHKNGSTIWVRDRGKVVARDNTGAAIRASGTRMDITLEKKKELALVDREQELQTYLIDMEETQQRLEMQAKELADLAEDQAEMRSRAEAAERSKSEFLASMSHEIRTPMTGVLGFADLLLAEELPESHRDKVEKIRIATTNLLTVINDILDLSKIEAGKLELETLPFAPRKLAEEVIDLVAGRALEREIQVTYHVDEDVPETLLGDPTRIRQVLLNLLGNGVKFTQEGSVSLTVSLSPIDKEEPLQFMVTDTGIGIPPDRIDMLFSNFTQADPSITRKFEGTGLGLAISKRLVEMMGGHIFVESILGSGSSFCFSLPMEEADARAVETSRPVGTSKFRSTRSLHILIVEDNEINQTIIGAFMGKAGHTFEIVDNGLKAVESVFASSFDLVLMDVRMPEMSGPEATRAIRAKDHIAKDIPIIALTADAMEQHVIGYREAGMNGYVSKPIDQADLLMTINEVIGEEVHEPVYAEPFHEALEPESELDLSSVDVDAVSAEIADIFANLNAD